MKTGKSIRRVFKIEESFDCSNDFNTRSYIDKKVIEKVIEGQCLSYVDHIGYHLCRIFGHIRRGDD